MNCGVRSFIDEEAYLNMKQEVAAPFKEGDFAAVIRLMDTHFGMHNYSIKDLFRDEQRHVLQLIIAGTLQEFEDKFITLYENSKGLMEFLKETGTPAPHHFRTTAETALNLRLRKMFTSETIDVDRLREDVEEVGSLDVALDKVALEFTIRRRMEGKMAALLAEPDNGQRAAELLLLVEAVAVLPVEVNLWQIQNMYWAMLQTRAADIRSAAGEADGLASLSETVGTLGHLLFFNVPAVLAAAEGDR
jgi:hypothetical protein